MNYDTVNVTANNLLILGYERDGRILVWFGCISQTSLLFVLLFNVRYNIPLQFHYRETPAV